LRKKAPVLHKGDIIKITGIIQSKSGCLLYYVIVQETERGEIFGSSGYLVMNTIKAIFESIFRIALY
jgi:hypothetical protein